MKSETLPWQQWAKDALYSLNSNCPRDEWIKILAAFQAATCGEGEDIAKEWSRIGSDPNEAHWETMWKNAWKHSKPNKVKARTLWYLAEEAGWKYSHKEATTQDTAAWVEQKRIALERAAIDKANKINAEAKIADLATQEWAITNRSFENERNYLVNVKHFTTEQLNTINAIGIDRDVVIIPLYDINGKIWNLQKIYYTPPLKSSNERKFFHPGNKINNGKGGRIKGCMFTLGDFDNHDVILITTGLADQIVLHLATGYPVINAMIDGNLKVVIPEILKKYPEPRYTIVNCADDDRWTFDREGNPKNSGRKTAQQLACLSLFPIFSETDLSNKPKDFWDVYELYGISEVKRQIDAFIRNNLLLPENFQLKNRKLYWQKTSAQEVSPEVYVSDYIKVVARATDSDGCYYTVVKFFNRRQTPETLIFPDETLENRAELYKQLRKAGLKITASSNKATSQLLIEYMNECNPYRWVEITKNTGWYNGKYVFITPNLVIGQTDREIMYNNSNKPSTGLWQSKGEIEDWQQHVAKYCARNTRLIFALAAGFAPPLLKFIPEAQGGFQLRGDSSEGKTVALLLAASVWGDKHTVQKWLNTANALDKIAFAYNFTLLPLDEIKQAPVRDIGQIVYMISDGRGKGRSTRSGDDLQKTKMFNIIFLSSGEKTLQQLLESVGQSSDAGMEARMADFTANAGKGLGIFEDIHDFSDSANMALTLTRNASKYYGTAAIEFLKLLTVTDEFDVEQSIKRQITEFKNQYCPKNAEGQVQRVVERFALVASAGELAIDFGILPFSKGDCTQAVATCFNQWIEDRGGLGQSERDKIIAHVLHFLTTNRFSRFYDSEFPAKNMPVNNAGSVKTSDGKIIYFVLPEVFKRELCSNFNYSAVANKLVDAGILIKPKNGRGFTRAEIVPHMYPDRTTSVYRLEIKADNTAEQTLLTLAQEWILVDDSLSLKIGVNETELHQLVNTLVDKEMLLIETIKTGILIKINN
jgi:putative DNA primase/helicase